MSFKELDKSEEAEVESEGLKLELELQETGLGLGIHGVRNLGSGVAQLSWGGVGVEVVERGPGPRSARAWTYV